MKTKTKGRPRKSGTVPKIGLEKTIKGQTKKEITRRYLHVATYFKSPMKFWTLIRTSIFVFEFTEIAEERNVASRWVRVVESGRPAL